MGTTVVICTDTRPLLFLLRSSKLAMYIDEAFVGGVKTNMIFYNLFR